MAKGQHLSRYQEGIVRRYYQHRDSTQVQRLEALVSDLAMDPASDKLWDKAGKALAALKLEPPFPPARIEQVVRDRKVASLATLIAEIARR